MKTERRHELQKNDLADWLGKHIDQIRPYSKVLMGVVLLAAAGAVAGMFIRRDQAIRDRQSWNDYYEAFGQRDVDALQEVAERHPGTEAAIWASQAAADVQLAQGIGDLYVSRDSAKKALEAAQKGYETVEALARDEMLKQRAWFGLAQVYESLSDIPKARDYYNRLATNAPESALGREAKRRLETLNEDATEKWYNWFSHQKPHPRLPSSQGLPGGPDTSNFPLDLGNLPDRPDISIPHGAAPAEEPAAPAAGPPKPDDTKSESTTPAKNPDSEPAPAKTDSSADRPPAEKKNADSSPSEPETRKKDAAPAENPSKNDSN